MTLIRLPSGQYLQLDTVTRIVPEGADRAKVYLTSKESIVVTGNDWSALHAWIDLCATNLGLVTSTTPAV